MPNIRYTLSLTLLLAGISVAFAEEPGTLSPAQQESMDWVDSQAQQLADVNRSLWSLAEVGLAEEKSADRLCQELDKAGFQVERGIAGMPTAFVASYGEGSPVIGILAEYDALPEMSQKTIPRREAVQEGSPGHACGHCAFGAGSLGGALAVRHAMEQYDLPGTIRLYGCPAEETLIGKVYMKLDGQFKDLDACLHWHPASKSQAQGGSSKAMVSVKFRFEGLPAHGSTSPHSGRSALDAVELMNVGVNYMREHIKEDARIHYVITNGGGQPNVVPPTAQVWYFIRADQHADVEDNFRWIQDIAKGAAMMTQTDMAMTIDTDCHEIIPNDPLTHLLQSSLETVGPPPFDQEDRNFAARLHATIPKDLSKYDSPLSDTISPATQAPAKGSTDVGDISWQVPTGGFRVTGFANGSPGHSWQNVAAIGSPIGDKAVAVASKTLAISVIEMLQSPETLAAARQDHQRRTQGMTYETLIPEGQKAPASIR